ncbi:MAG: nitroreductase family deazaflavin-dependent oxidoreductase [Anaerolineae bacterium]
MDSPYKPPPNLPKWMLHLQVWLLRHRLMGPLSKEMMVITTTGRKSGNRYSVPIGYVRDGEAVVALNIHARSNWYQNARVNPHVSLNVRGHEFPAQAEDLPVDTPEAVNAVLEPFRREQPRRFEQTFQIPPARCHAGPADNGRRTHPAMRIHAR